MSHFYGSMRGSRKEVTRTGLKNEGMEAHIRGWNLGVRVFITHKNGKDLVHIYRTGGSNNPAPILMHAWNEDGRAL